MDTPTTQPAPLDTLTDTVGSRIEITAAGKKYTGYLEWASSYTSETIELHLRDIKAAE